jgi:hypothetical protein
VQAQILHAGARVEVAGSADVQMSTASASSSLASPINAQGSMRSRCCYGVPSIQRRSRERGE